MNVHVNEISPYIRTLVKNAVEVGCEREAIELKEAESAAYTTSSEYLGEVGGALIKFWDSIGCKMPESSELTARKCLNEIKKVWPNFKLPTV